MKIQSRMAANLQERIDKIQAKAALMVELHGQLQRALDDARKRIDELESVISRQQRELEERDRQIEYLKVASVLSPDHRDVEEARAVLSGLVREIDKCINQLSL
ncbi:MAG: DUF3450 domain-containing protein [Bacteroides sp.]|nr:DUF3450 domain-containing protein [Bacteroides sp.]